MYSAYHSIRVLSFILKALAMIGVMGVFICSLIFIIDVRTIIEANPVAPLCPSSGEDN